MSDTQTSKPPRERLEQLARAHGTRLRLQVTDATGPEHERVFNARAELLTVHQMHLYADGSAPNVKAARAKASAALFAVIAALPVEVLGPEVSVRRRR